MSVDGEGKAAMKPHQEHHMGWDITVGNAKIANREDDDSQYHLTIETIEHPDAPCWPNPEGDPFVVGLPDASGKTNCRRPSYTGLAQFIRATGIVVNAFQSARGSDCECYILRPEDLTSVTDARKRWEAAHPRAVPGWCEGNDATLAKLIWYEWWFDYALKTCERPSIQMS